MSWPCLHSLMTPTGRDGHKDAEKSAGTDWMCELKWILLSLGRSLNWGKTGAKESGSGLKHMPRSLFRFLLLGLFATARIE